jgi:hypothetical protein
MNIIKHYERAILRAYKASNKETIVNGLIWYRNANKIVKNIASINNIDIEIVSQVVSSLSPATSWHQNIKDSYRLVNKPYESTKVGTYGMNKSKALLIIKNQVSLKFEGAPKTFSFYRNILLDSNYVTVDRWILRLLNIPTNKAIPKKTYNDIVTAFLNVAKKLDIKGYQLQAICWIYIRDQKD